MGPRFNKLYSTVILEAEESEKTVDELIASLAQFGTSEPGDEEGDGPKKSRTLRAGTFRSDIVLCFMGILAVEEVKPTIIDIFTNVATLHQRYISGYKTGEALLDEVEQRRRGPYKWNPGRIKAQEKRAEAEFEYARNAIEVLGKIQVPLIERLQGLVHDAATHIEQGIKSAVNKNVKSFEELSKLVVLPDQTKAKYLKIIYKPEIFTKNMATYIDSQQDRDARGVTMALLTMFKSALQKGKDTGAIHSKQAFVNYLIDKKSTTALKSFAGSQKGKKVLSQKDPSRVIAINNLKKGNFEEAILGINLSSISTPGKENIIKLINDFKNGRTTEGDVVRAIYSA